MPFFITVLLSLLSGTLAAEQLTTANTNRPPWRVLDNDGHLSGIDIDILKHLSKRLQLPLVTKGCGWKRCLQYIKVGASDIMTGLYKTPEREQYMKFIEPPYRTSQNFCFYVNKAASIEINDYQDLQKLTVGVVHKVVHFARFDSDNNIKKYPATTGKDLIRLLKAQRIDAIIKGCEAGNLNIKRLGLNSIIKRANYIYHSTRPIYLAMSKKSPLLTREKIISHDLQHMLNSGEIEQIISNHKITAIKQTFIATMSKTKTREK